jgi:hypothetical protein
MPPSKHRYELSNSRPGEPFDRVLRYLVDPFVGYVFVLLLKLLLQSRKRVFDRLLLGIKDCPVHRRAPLLAEVQRVSKCEIRVFGNVNRTRPGECGCSRAVQSVSDNTTLGRNGCRCGTLTTSAPSPAASRPAPPASSGPPRSRSATHRTLASPGWPQNSPIRSTRSMSGSMTTWRSSARAAGWEGLPPSWGAVRRSFLRRSDDASLTLVCLGSETAQPTAPTEGGAG